MKEIEILIEVKSTKEEALKALEQFEFQGMKKTLDIYFYDPLRQDLQADENNRLKNCFRLRKKNGKSSIAYKVDYFNDNEWSHSDEYETEVKDFDAVLQIIEKLGLQELIRVDNEKHTFLIPVYEIVLEDVKNLGLYLEVEKLAQVSDEKVVETKEEIRTFIKTLGIEFGNEQNAGKPELLIRKKKLI
jgi:adenylate cyclase, class 2